MPWREVWPMEEKLRFVAAVLEDEDSMAALCAEFGVSRKTGYKWLHRFQEQGAQGLSERSRAPHRVPWAISEAQGEAIIALRRAHPMRGPKKLRALLVQRAPEQLWPAPSTIGEVLERAGMVRRRRARHRAVPNPSPLSAALSANEVWAIDFKGWFRTQDGARCDPLTVSDWFSRYLLCAEVVERADYLCCHAVLERLFRKYGLPGVIRSDNGAPFASAGAGGLSRLGVWWVKLGIWPERITPGHPQQNGRHERMHRTLKAECANPPAATRQQQQRRLDQFRREYNQQRPHEALGQTPPAHHYSCSARRYPARLEDPSYPADYQLRRVRSKGEIKWQGELIFIGEALCGEVIAIQEQSEGDGEVYFGPVPLGIIDALSLKLLRTKSSKQRRGGRPSSPSSPSECKKV